MIRRLPVALAMAAALSLVQPVLAQGRGGFRTVGLSPTRLTPRLQMELKLTDDQKANLEALEMRLREERRTIFQSGGGQGAFEQLRTLNQKGEMEGLALFTDAQKTQYQGWKTELEPYAGLGRSHVAILAVTGLTDEQKEKLKTLSMSMQAKRAAARENAAGGGNLREVMQQLEDETSAEMKKILNADQQKQLETEAATIPRDRRRQ